MQHDAPRGLIVAAPASGQGKTTVTLGLLRALESAGRKVAAFKVGPDYIDPGFHRAALRGRDAGNLDLWAMRPQTLWTQLSETNAEIHIAEGMMGLFDGAGADGKGSAADLAAQTAWPVVLVVDASAQAASVAALVRGFASHWPGVRVAGVIFNKVGSDGHGRLLADAMAHGLPDVAVLGWLVRDEALAVPERHLGLVLAGEHPALEDFLGAAGKAIAAAVDLDAVCALAGPAKDTGAAQPTSPPIPVLGQRIAVARDAAFAFTYPHVLEGWRRAGAEIGFFSPLDGQTPGAGLADPDAIYLPGGYPELHAGRIAGAPIQDALRSAADKAAAIYGECGGYMVMGEGLVDADGNRHRMAGLLPVETSFADPVQHFGYRQVDLAADGLLGSAGAAWRAHEFHHCSVVSADDENHLFACSDAAGRALGPAGHVASPRIAGSFIHLIDRAGA